MYNALDEIPHRKLTGGDMCPVDWTVHYDKQIACGIDVFYEIPAIQTATRG